MKLGLLFICINLCFFAWNFSQAIFLWGIFERIDFNSFWFLFITLALLSIIIVVICKMIKKEKNIFLIQYSPPKWIDSAKAGLLLYRRSDSVSIVSLIYKWLWDWLISVDLEQIQGKKSKDKKVSYVLHKKNEISEIAPSYELLFWKSIFDSWETAIISGNQDLNLEPSLKAMEEYWYNSWWFSKRGLVDEPGFVVMCIIIFLMIILWITPNSTENKEYMSLFLVILYLILYCFPKIWVLVGIEVPKFKKLKLTKEGKKLVSHILWYREFLRTCDAEVLKTFLKQDPLYFDKILSYAIVFWIESELIKKLTPIMDEIGLKLYVSQFKNPFYSIFKDKTENSPLTDLLNSANILEGESWWGFK